MASALLFGWDQATWKRAFAWATQDMPSMYDEVSYPTFLSIRNKWLMVGGPDAGPTLELDAVHG